MLLIASHVLVITYCFPKKTQLRELPKNLDFLQISFCCAPAMLPLSYLLANLSQTLC